MIAKTAVCLMLIMLFALVGCSGTSEQPTESPVVKVEPTPDEKVAELEQMCAGAAEAMAARQAEATLFDRIGGVEGIKVVVDDTVERQRGPGGSVRLGSIVTRRPTRNRRYVRACRGCGYRDLCGGVFEAYVDHFGDGEIDPIGQPA